MASVKKRADSPYWVMVYKANGKWRQRSSRTTDKNQALLLACSLQGTGAHWDRDRAERLVEELAHANGTTLRDPTLMSEFISDWVTARMQGWSDSTRKTFKAVENQFCSRCGHIPLGSITSLHISEYRDFLTRQGRSPSNVRQHIKFLRRVFNTAIEQDRIEENPAAVSLPKKKASVKQPFSLAQFKALLNATDGEWHTLILVAGLTGQRLQDCLRLCASDFHEDKIGFRRKKNSDILWVPRHPAIQFEAVGALFPELDALPKTGFRSVSAKFRDHILPRIGIVQEYGENLGGCRKVTEFSFHSFRHMLSTELNRIGASPETRMAIVGHDDQKVSAGYTHADFEVAKETLARVVV